MAEIAVPAALFIIDKFLSSMHLSFNLYTTIQSDAEDIKKWLRAMQAYLADMDRSVSNDVLKERMNLVRDVAHHIEDVLEELMFYAPHRYHTHKISEKAHEFSRAIKVRNPLSSIQGMKSKIANIRKKIDDIITIDKLCEYSHRRRSCGSSPGLLSGQQVVPHAPDDEEIVGFKEQREAMINQLTEVRAATSSCNMVATISVVGPGGSGKTFLTKNIFEFGKRIKGGFDCHAWLLVSQSFKIDDLLQSMVSQFSECENEERELALSAQVDTHARLKYYLRQKKYLLVLDDVWSAEHWKCIMERLPTNLGMRESRIIVTTRNSEVASFCAEPPRYLINLEAGLQISEAWYLFCMKAFPNNDERYCPPELERLSKKFLEWCEGLPLAIVDVGTVLSKKRDNRLLEWQKVHDSLGKCNLRSATCKVLLPSYKDLPSNLRSCFLYFSIFPKDYAVERGRLIRLWIAEGFVPKTKGQTMEEVAEVYLSELIGRNLVRVIKWDFDDRARYCRVQSNGYDFILQKSEEVNFISVLSEGSYTSGDQKFRRLSLQNNGGGPCIRDKDLSLVRSAFFFKGANTCLSSIIDILHRFKLLRVLDLRDAPLDEFPEAIVHLVLLKYLCLRNTRIKRVPKSIKWLSQLETLDLRRTDVTQLPKKISRLRNLRHLLVYRFQGADNNMNRERVRGVELFEGIGLLNTLQKLLLVKPDKNQNVLKELGDLVQLRKLGLIGLKTRGGKDLCTSIEKMRDLSTLDISSTSKEEPLDLNYIDRPPPRLQRLYLNGRLHELPVWISKLNNLLKISLKWSGLNSSTFEALQCLPNLIELEMVGAFVGDELVFKERSFKKLKILHIEQFDHLEIVIIEEGSIFELQKLSLSSCANLVMVPLGINTLASLKELLLYNMPQEFILRLIESNTEDREIVSHVPVINTFVLGADGSWLLDQDLS